MIDLALDDRGDGEDLERRIVRCFCTRQEIELGGDAVELVHLILSDTTGFDGLRHDVARGEEEAFGLAVSEFWKFELCELLVGEVRVDVREFLRDDRSLLCHRRTLREGHPQALLIGRIKQHVERCFDGEFLLEFEPARLQLLGLAGLLGLVAELAHGLDDACVVEDVADLGDAGAARDQDLDLLGAFTDVVVFRGRELCVDVVDLVEHEPSTAEKDREGQQHREHAASVVENGGPIALLVRHQFPPSTSEPTGAPSRSSASRAVCRITTAAAWSMIPRWAFTERPTLPRLRDAAAVDMRSSTSRTSTSCSALAKPIAFASMNSAAIPRLPLRSIGRPT